MSAQFGGKPMKTRGKPWQFFVVALLIIVISLSAIIGVSSTYGDITTTWIKGAADIRFGIDIRGGLEVTFMPQDDIDATPEQMAAAQSVIEQRLISLNITDSEVYRDDSKNRIILRFPWKDGEQDFNPESAIQEIGATAVLTFREGAEVDEFGAPSGLTAQSVILQGTDVKSAMAAYDSQDPSNPYYISLELEESGIEKFAEATTRLAETYGTISIWMDDTMVSSPTVNTAIPDGQAMITLTGNSEETRQQAITLANQINSGSLPFSLSAESYRTISPSLGSNSLQAMVIAGIIAFVLVAIYMILNYKLHGAVAVIALFGQVSLTIAFVSGYLPFVNSFTLTLPGIAGIILAIGMGVDANVIAGERIREEIRSGKNINSAIRSGFDRGLSPIIDGNVTVIIVALILMGVFGAGDNFVGQILSWMGLGATTSGTIYSFGYTLLVGVLMNFVFGVMCTRVMMKGVSKLKIFRNPALYGGVKNEKTV